MVKESGKVLEGTGSSVMLKSSESGPEGVLIVSSPFLLKFTDSTMYLNHSIAELTHRLFHGMLLSCMSFVAKMEFVHPSATDVIFGGHSWFVDLNDTTYRPPGADRYHINRDSPLSPSPPSSTQKSGKVKVVKVVVVADGKVAASAIVL